MFLPPDDHKPDPPAEVEPFTRITVPMCFYKHTSAKKLRRLFAPPWYVRAFRFIRNLFP